MSLIADALKAALDEKRQAMPPPHALAPKGFLSFRSPAAPARSSFPRGVQIVLGALAAAGVVGLFIALLLPSSHAAGRPRPAVTPPVIKAVAPEPMPAAAVMSAPVGSPVPIQPAVREPDPAPSAPIRSTPVTGARVATAPAAQQPSDGGASRPTVGDEAIVPSVRQQPAMAPADVVNDRARNDGAFKITMEPSGREGNTLFLDALAAQKRGDVSRARDLYARAIERSPNNAELHNNVGLLYRSTGELERAEDAYQRAIAINPKFAAAWSNLGVLLEQRGKRKEATAALQQALSLDPSNTGSKVNLANQFYAIGVYAEARRLLEEVLRVRPSLAEAHYALGRTLESLGEHAGAVQEYELFLTTGAGQFPALERQVTQHLRSLKGGKGGDDA